GEKRIKNLEIHRTEEKEKTSVVTKRVSDLFGDIRKQLDDTEKRVLAEISRQEEDVSQSVSNVIQKLEEQKDELSRKINQMEELCNTQDPLTVLKKTANREDISPEIGKPINAADDVGCLDDGIISQMLHNGLLHFTDSLIDLKIRRQFSVMEKSDILLDINTAYNNIIISEDLKTATYSDTCQNRPENPERFESQQVLSTNSFTSGKHYWEVDVSGAEKWLTGVATHSIERKINGNESYIGYNDKSWGLHVIETFGTRHNNIFKRLNSDSPVKSVGIYLDYEAGRLSFYQLCDPIRHLHTFTATFTEPLHAAFYLFEKCSIKIKKSNI
ncbi:E3 ubiquitin-protein ligase TRIM39-like, partial [Pyxicephalus adspersus]|uniref:E3 ubiquitin-protein ligase TRIM39-like n=1 Tax=Pyxicephalus adspersus TaxID=30357 RepID=UPI003B5B7467